MIALNSKCPLAQFLVCRLLDDILLIFFIRLDYSLTFRKNKAFIFEELLLLVNL